MSVIMRGNTVDFAFTFLDVNGDAAEADSATVTLTYPGLCDWQKEVLTLTLDEDDGMWKASWDSSKSRPAWVEYHAHAIASPNELIKEGRFKVRGNRSGMQHDRLPRGSGDYDGSVS
jgi:hypothetical protein